MTGSLYLGTSGFAYKEWKDVFYPETLKEREMLGFYASRFRSVEINYSFRRLPSESALRTWVERTPEEFRFALKAHQRITHTRRLDPGEEGMGWFLDRLAPLGERRGPVLFQCPPSLRFDRRRIEAFLASLPADGSRFAMEFRHPSWNEARDLLTERDVAWCVADTDETPADPRSVDARPFAYLRLRKEHYADDELARWAERIGGTIAAGRDVFCYLKHEEKGTGPRYAERLAALVSERRASEPS